MGDKGCYLDEYLSVIFEVLGKLDLRTSVSIADNICWSVLGDCYLIFEDKCENEKSEFYDIVKDYIDKHIVDFKSRHTKSEFYAANILLENLGIFSQKFKQMLIERCLSNIDYKVCNKMYANISEIVEEVVERLNDRIYKAFILCPIVMSASNQIIMRSMQMLIYRDGETSKKIYERMITEDL